MCYIADVQHRSHMLDLLRLPQVCLSYLAIRHCVLFQNCSSSCVIIKYRRHIYCNSGILRLTQHKRQCSDMSAVYTEVGFGKQDMAAEQQMAEQQTAEQRATRRHKRARRHSTIHKKIRNAWYTRRKTTKKSQRRGDNRDRIVARLQVYTYKCSISPLMYALRYISDAMATLGKTNMRP